MATFISHPKAEQVFQEKSTVPVELLIDASPNAIIFSDASGRITWFNQQAEMILGYLEGKDFPSHVYEVYYEKREAAVIGQELAKNKDTLQNRITSFRSRSGECIWVRLSATTFYDAQGQRQGTVGYFEDMRSFQALENRVQLFARMSLMIAQAENLNEGLYKFAELVASFLSHTFCRVLLLDERGVLFVVKAAASRSCSTTPLAWAPQVGCHLEPSVAFGSSSIWNMKDVQAFYWHNPEQQPVLRDLSSHLELMQPVRSLLRVPLELQGKLLGFLEIGELERAEQRPISSEDKGWTSAIAAQAVTFIERLRQRELVKRRNELLERLEERLQELRPEQGEDSLLHQVVLLVPGLVGGVASGLYTNFPASKQLRLRCHNGLFPELGPERGLERCVAEQVAWIKQQKTNLNELQEKVGNLIVGVPLKQFGEVEYVLVVTYAQEAREFLEAELEVLQLFADRVSISLRIAQSLNPDHRRRGLSPLLLKISDHMQVTKDLDKIFHIILTTVTAGYGLGFTRAALFLLDASQNELIGKMGINHFPEETQETDWQQKSLNKADELNEYLSKLEEGSLVFTPVGEAIRRLSLPLSSNSDNPFTQSVTTGQVQLVFLPLLRTLPKPFLEAFAPQSDLIIVPLKARNRVLGLIIAAKKFLDESISPDDVDLLMTVANTAAIAIDNLQLLHETEVAQQRLRSLYEASSDLVSIQVPSQLLRSIVERLKEVSGAAWVRWTIVDDEGLVYDHDVVGTNRKFELRTLHPEGIAKEVLQKGKAIAIENTQHQQDRNRLNPLVFEEQLGAVLCLPISMYEKQIGLMWLNYRAPRAFSQSEIEDLQFYVNQAAVALGRARQDENLEKIRWAAETLAAVSSSQDEVLQQIVESARTVFDADSAVVWTYDIYQGQFLLADAQAQGINAEAWMKIRELEPQWRQGALSILDKGWIGIPDVNTLDNQDFWPGEVRQWIEQIGECSFQGIALAVGEEKLGVLFLNYNLPRSFSKQDEELARAFGNHTAFALKKIQLLEQVRKAKQTAEVVARVMALGDHDKTLDAITQGTCEALRCDAVTLWTYDQDSDTIHSPPKMANVQFPEKVERWGSEPKGTVVWRMLEKEEAYVVEEIATDPFIKSTRFARDEGIHSCVVVPLKVSERKTGVMFVNYRSHRRFLDDELASIQHFADQAAVAIYNAQLYKQAQRQAEALEALYYAGQAVTGTLDSREILQRIGEQAWRLMGRSNPQAVASDVWLVEDGVVKLVAAWPDSSKNLLPHEINLAPKISRKSGVVGRTTRIGVLQLVSNVTEDEDYIPFRLDTRSELAVPIIASGKVVAVINLEHPDFNAFLPEDVQALEALAAQASIAIQNARQYEELEKTKDQLAAKTAVAWMGITSATWRHATRTDAITIRDTADLLRSDLEHEATEEKIRSRLDSIKRLAKKIQDAPITAPLSAHEGTQIIAINDFLRDRVNQLRKNQSVTETHKGVSFRYLSSSDTPYFVRGNPYWFAQAFDLLVQNAVKAMVSSVSKEIVVTTQPARGGVKISLADTGKGIPPKVHKLLLHRPIPEDLHPNGSGMGVLLAQTIFQTYGGDLCLEATGPTGTTMSVWLPVSERKSEERTITTPGGVLFVSDSEEKPENVSLLNKALAPFDGVQVVLEEKALERISQKDHKVVLLDGPSIADLPTLIRQIHERQPTIKILVLTSAPDWRAAREFLRLGATDYIDKSTNLDELKAIFARLFVCSKEALVPSSVRLLASEEESEAERRRLYA